MATGIIPIDKPQGWTSQDVAARLRRVFQTRRIGHGGTLDPMATGVLPIFVGRATRAVEFFESAQKEYIATLRLGLLTDTQDVTGRILETRPADVSPEALEAVLARFLGPQMQVPPMYSALKVNGQKLYELARQGKAVERQPRPITIYELELLEFRNGDCRLRVRCSKDCITGYQYICPCFHQAGTSFQIHSTIYFNQCFRTCSFYQGTQFTDFLYRMFNELLSAKSWIYAHNKHHIYILNNILK